MESVGFLYKPYQKGQPKSEDGAKDGCWNFIACWIRGHRLTKLTFIVHLGEIGWQVRTK